MDARDLLRVLYPAMRRADVKRFRFHDLRHAFATRLVQAGCDIYTLQKLGPSAAGFRGIRIVDLGGNVRENPKLSGTKHNVFGIQTGVAISFMVKRARHKGCRVFYSRRPELETAEEKLSWLSGAQLSALTAEEIAPDEAGTWVNPGERDLQPYCPC
jgi:hypothetical protein